MKIFPPDMARLRATDQTLLQPKFPQSQEGLARSPRPPLPHSTIRPAARTGKIPLPPIAQTLAFPFPLRTARKSKTEPHRSANPPQGRRQTRAPPCRATQTPASRQTASRTPQTRPRTPVLQFQIAPRRQTRSSPRTKFPTLQGLVSVLF